MRYEEDKWSKLNYFVCMKEDKLKNYIDCVPNQTVCLKKADGKIHDGQCLITGVVQYFEIMLYFQKKFLMNKLLN